MAATNGHTYLNVEEKPVSVNEPINIQPAVTNTPSAIAPINLYPAVVETPNIQPVVTNTAAAGEPVKVQPAVTSTVAESVKFQATVTHATADNKDATADANKPTNSQLAATNTPASNDPLKPRTAPSAPSSGENSAVIKTIGPLTIVTDDSTKSKPTVTVRLPSTAPSQQSTSTGALGGTVFKLIILCIIATIPILQIIIGSIYGDDCRANWRIPQYLVVAGAVGTTAILLPFINIVITVCLAANGGESGAVLACITACCGTCAIMFIVTILLLFLVAWFIAGCIWVFRAWSKIQYIDPLKSNYCHPTLYRFAFWLLLVSLLFYIFSCIGLCFYKRIQNKYKGKGIPKRIPTNEP